MLTLLALFGCVGCNDHDDDEDPPPAFEAPPATIEMIMQSTSAQGETSTITKWLDTRDPDWTVMKLGASSADAPVVTFTHAVEDDELVIGGFTVDPTAPGAASGLPPIEFVADEPITGPLDPPVGEPQSTRFAGTVLIDGTPEELDIPVDYTLVSDDETVQTALGTVSGARHYQGSGVLFEEPVRADVWLVSGTGIVRVDYTWDGLPELFGGSAAMAESRWYTDANGRRLMGARGVVGPTHPTLTLSTYDAKDTFDADKDTHAQMLLLARWADPERAKTDEMPPLTLDFGTTWGYYDAFLVATDDPLDEHEADEGYVVWAAFVDQAAKNQTDNPISYHCGATWAGSGEGDVQLMLSIDYKLLE